MAYHDVHSAEHVLQLVRQKRKDIPVVVRAAGETTVEKLKRTGTTEVIPQVIEGGLMIAAEALVQCGIPVDKAMTKVRSARAQRYSSLKQYYEESPK